VRLYLTPGNINDCSAAIDVLAGVPIEGSVVLGDKAYGTREIREYIASRGATYCIPPKSNAADPWEHDKDLYKERHLVECFFNKFKQFSLVATR
jgi:transposase